jgi:hypothetical protein
MVHEPLRNGISGAFQLCPDGIDCCQYLHSHDHFEHGPVRGKLAGIAFADNSQRAPHVPEKVFSDSSRLGGFGASMLAQREEFTGSLHARGKTALFPRGVVRRSWWNPAGPSRVNVDLFT